MSKQINYDEIASLTYECDCTGVSIDTWDRLMNGAVRANKKEIDRLVKWFIPELYESLALNYYNPYDYFRTKTHLVLVHSMIEYFLKFN